MAKVLNAPPLKAKAEAVGIYPVTSTPADFAAFIQHEAARWLGVVKNSGLHFD
jgi:tripartite-type tricarboxylate transporter receptor subunit TctC